MYKDKYLKYKNKYITLKNQSGSSLQSKPLFYIYTTGIADWGNLDKLLLFWNKLLCDHVCSLIPPRFDIKILHSDILLELTYGIGPNHMILDQKVYLTEQINLLLLENLENERIVESSFQTEPLNFREIRGKIPYLIIDFAHLFKYSKDLINISPNGSVKVFQNYNDLELNDDGLELNVIYVGYLGENQILDSKLSKRYISLLNFFRVNDDNTVITIINKLLNKIRFNQLLDQELFDPTDRIDIIMKQIRRKLQDKFREKYIQKNSSGLGLIRVDYQKFEEIFNKPEINKEITRMIMDYIMDDVINQNDIILRIFNTMEQRIIL